MGCIFKLDCYELDFLRKKSLDSDEEDSNDELKDLKEGSKIFLPFWLAKELISRNIIQAEIPKKYSTKNLKSYFFFNLKVIDAGPEEVDLSKY